MAAREENIGGAFPFLLLVSALRIFTPQYNPFTSTVFITHSVSHRHEDINGCLILLIILTGWWGVRATSGAWQCYLQADTLLFCLSLINCC